MKFQCQISRRKGCALESIAIRDLFSMIKSKRTVRRHQTVLEGRTMKDACDRFDESIEQLFLPGMQGDQHDETDDDQDDRD